MDHELAFYVTGGRTGEDHAFRFAGHRSEREIYQRFATPRGSSSIYYTRPSWDKKSRKVKREMIAGSIRRLVFVGQIRIVETVHPDSKSMHGILRRNAKSDQRLFGEDHDGVIRSYGPSTVLDALAEAIGDVE